MNNDVAKQAMSGELSLSSTLTSPEKALELLNEQGKHFIKRVEKVADNIYVGIGYHGATTSMIVGDDGLIIIDTLQGYQSAVNACEAFREYSDKPVKAIIYTHSHPDHTGGASAFVAENAVLGTDYDVIATATKVTASGIDMSLKEIAMKRNVRQFGRKLPKEEQTNRGVAPAGTIDKDAGAGHIPANINITSDYKATICGIEIELILAPGETDDALFVWLPKQKVLFAGDNFYQAFPNLYAIRGTPYRDVRVWAKSVKLMASYKPEILIAGHTSPIISEKESVEALENYSNAIQYVFDKTVEGMNKDLDPITISQSIELPAEFADKPYIRQFYGTVEGASRAIYAGLLGWFGGNPSDLNPLTAKANAKNMARLAGGNEALYKNFEKALEDKEYQWALQLADSLLLLENVDNIAVTKGRIAAMRAMASMEYNAPKRNYYLSFANELEANLS